MKSSQYFLFTRQRPDRKEIKLEAAKKFEQAKENFDAAKEELKQLKDDLKEELVAA